MYGESRATEETKERMIKLKQGFSTLALSTFGSGNSLLGKGGCPETWFLSSALLPSHFSGNPEPPSTFLSRSLPSVSVHYGNIRTFIVPEKTAANLHLV